MNFPGRCITTGLLVFAVLGSALGVVYAKHKSRELFIELQALQASQDALDTERGQLQLEQSALATQNRLDDLTRTRLEMIVPPPETVVLIRP